MESCKMLDVVALETAVKHLENVIATVEKNHEGEKKRPFVVDVLDRAKHIVLFGRDIIKNRKD